MGKLTQRTNRRVSVSIPTPEKLAPTPEIQVGEIFIYPWGRWRRFKWDFGFGLVFGFPLCCVLRFALDSARMDGKLITKEQGQAYRRGSKDMPNGERFVPCGVFHKKDRDCNCG